MKGIIAILLIAAATTSFANDLSQVYEKAYFLETAKGQTAEAIQLYNHIVTAAEADEQPQPVIHSLERLLLLRRRQQTRTVQQKVEIFNYRPFPLRDHIINTFGIPERYASGDREYEADEIPGTGYKMYYPEGFSVQVSGAALHSISFDKPVYSVKGLTIGSDAEEVLRTLPPEKTLDYYSRQGNGFELGTLYTNMVKTSDIKIYYTSGGISFFLANGKVSNMTINYYLLKKQNWPRPSNKK